MFFHAQRSLRVLTTKLPRSPCHPVRSPLTMDLALKKTLSQRVSALGQSLLDEILRSSWRKTGENLNEVGGIKLVANEMILLDILT